MQAEFLYQTTLGGHFLSPVLDFFPYGKLAYTTSRPTETDGTSMSRDCEILIFALVSLAVTCMMEGRDSNNTAVLTATPRKEREGSDSCKRGGLPTFFSQQGGVERKDTLCRVLIGLGDAVDCQASDLPSKLPLAKSAASVSSRGTAIRRE
jgi:hypothetical protein